ncbi:MAG: hypothetical protein KC766_16390 [Myxococcales bacterium]|nr:hypothetical protein [Myxococcales bacterium]
MKTEENDGGASTEVAAGASLTSVSAADTPVASPAEAVELGLLTAEAREATRDAAMLLSSLRLPSLCACCCAPASASRKLDLADHSGVLIVPLCDRCLTHEAVSRTRSLSVLLAALLIGGSMALGLPLALERLADSGHWQLSVNSWFSRWGLFVLPCGIVCGLLGLRALSWHLLDHGRTGRRCAAGPAVALRQTPRDPEHVAVLRCAQAQFAEQLLELNSGRLSRLVARPSRVWDAALPALGGRWMVAVVFLTALLSVGSFAVHRPRIQVLNLTEHPLTLEVDGEVVANVPITSQESAEAGAQLRLPAGRRHFRALAGDQIVAEADLTLQGAARHLYAPASPEHCFWLERISYGRGNAAEPIPGHVERLPLASPLRFWAFSRPPDIWLAPPPEPLLDDARSSGGEVTALRQARCSDAPAGARPSG